MPTLSLVYLLRLLCSLETRVTVTALAWGYILCLRQTLGLCCDITRSPLGPVLSPFAWHYHTTDHKRCFPSHTESRIRSSSNRTNDDTTVGAAVEIVNMAPRTGG